MLDLNDFFYYVQVVDRGGFTAASRTLRVPKSTLSHRIRQLETQLDVRLLNRTSRQFNMTDAGEEFYHHAVHMLQHAEKAEAVIRQRQSEPTGTVRFTAAVAVSQFAVSSILADFVAKYPKVKLVHNATDQMLDLVGENLDVAIRAHTAPLPDSTLVRRTLAPAPWFLFAGTGFVERCGVPQSPEELAQYDTLFMLHGQSPPSWTLRNTSRPTSKISLALSPRVASDDMVSLKHAVRAGLGIVALPGYVCRDDVRKGEMVQVLPGWSAGESTLTALIPFRHGLLPSVRVFLDHLVAELPKVVRLD